MIRRELQLSTSTSLLNAQLCQLHARKKEDRTKEDDAREEATVDEMERASALLALETSVQEIEQDVAILEQHCRRMKDELGEKKVLSSRISIARRNLKELDHQMHFYDELPQKVQSLHDALEMGRMNVVDVYVQWREMDEWRQKMLTELRVAAVEKSDELGHSDTQARILASMTSRLHGMESIATRIDAEVWGCLHHCVELAQFQTHRLVDAFQVLDFMEQRRKRLVHSKKDDKYLDNQLNPVSTFHIPIKERCETEIVHFLSKRIENIFQTAKLEVERANTDVLSSVLDAATQLMLDLDIVQSHVAPCFPNEIDVVQLFTSTYTVQFEAEMERLSERSDVGLSQRLQLIQWIDYYNTEITKYKHSRASIVLNRTAEKLLRTYLTEMQAQCHMWITNLWQRDDKEEDERAVGFSRPNDIIHILKAHISIAHEWINGQRLGLVISTCLHVLMEELKSRYETLATKLETVEMERLCSFLNEAEVLQAKCPDLAEEVSFGDSESSEKKVVDAALGDTLEAASTEIVVLATNTCDLIVKKIFDEMEQETTKWWFSKKWDNQAPVIETLLATLEDYYTDLKLWIVGSFFFSKIVRQCLNQCVRVYCTRLLHRTHAFARPLETAAIVDKDRHVRTLLLHLAVQVCAVHLNVERLCVQNFVAFFTKYSADLRQTGIRSESDISKEFALLQVMICRLRGEAFPDSNSPQTAEILRHIMKLSKATESMGHKLKDKTKKKEGSKKKRFRAFVKGKKSKVKSGKEKHDAADEISAGKATVV
ncbi:hypothetical protein PsorP6_003240 [Peronosclerospora sorghi]|uniref:Uncharacterized protein n=1 Tax=Peronosclerospora sorghi TaxID=230839 RepID=A0ACC0VN55_9STRA|nr:hypothetical protein PsorP6_003240 [Peronosclerospora sorghi]